MTEILEEDDRAMDMEVDMEVDMEMHKDEATVDEETLGLQHREEQGQQTNSGAICNHASCGHRNQHTRTDMLRRFVTM